MRACNSSFMHFSEHDMDGEAISAAFASSPGPDCLRDVIPKLGHRLKVYAALKCVLEECQVSLHSTEC